MVVVPSKLLGRPTLESCCPGMTAGCDCTLGGSDGTGCNVSVGAGCAASWGCGGGASFAREGMLNCFSGF